MLLFDLELGSGYSNLLVCCCRKCQVYQLFYIGYMYTNVEKLKNLTLSTAAYMQVRMYPNLAPGQKVTDLNFARKKNKQKFAVTLNIFIFMRTKNILQPFLIKTVNALDLLLSNAQTTFREFVQVFKNRREACVISLNLMGDMCRFYKKRRGMCNFLKPRERHV